MNRVARYINLYSNNEDAENNRDFIEENIEEIDKYFNVMRENYKDMSDIEILETIINELKAKKYANLLYYKKEKTCSEDMMNKVYDKSFILKNIKKIDKKFQEMKEYAEQNGEEFDEQETMQLIFDTLRTEKYLDILYSNPNKAEEKDMFDKSHDRSFIFENIEKIDRKFEDFKINAERNGEEFNEYETMQLIFDTLRTEKYLGILYKNVDKPEEIDMFEKSQNKRFIFRNIERIDKIFYDRILNAERSGQIIDEQELIKTVIEEVKAENLEKLKSEKDDL